MGTINIVGTYIGGFKKRSIPQQLGAVVHIENFTTPVNGYWIDKSGKNKQIQAATTTTLNDSLIMPANDVDIILALKKIDEYNTYYSNDSTPNKVLLTDIPQISRIKERKAGGTLVTGEFYNLKGTVIEHNNIFYKNGDSFIAGSNQYTGFGNVVKGLDNACYFNQKNKTNFILFNKTINESGFTKIYDSYFDYFPITTYSDTFSVYLVGNGNITIDWDDSDISTYTLISTTLQISHTYTSRLGKIKNIKITAGWQNIKIIAFDASVNSTAANFDITKLLNLTRIQVYNCISTSVSGSFSKKIMESINLYRCLSTCTGDLSLSQLYDLQLPSDLALNSAYGDISNSPIKKINAFGAFLGIKGNLSNKALTQSSINSSIELNGDLITSIAFNSNPITIKNQKITYNSGNIPAFQVDIILYNNWNTNTVDLFLNNFSTTAPTVTSRTIDLTGNNAGRSIVSDASVSVLNGKGWSVKTNNGWIFRGDSITYGAGANPILTNKWTSLLCSAKNKVEINKGVGGASMSEINQLNNYKSLINNEIPYTYENLLFLAYGVNDIGRGASVNEFISYYSNSIDFLLNEKGYSVDAIKIIGVFYCENIASITIPYNDAIKNLALNRGIQFFDVFTVKDGTSTDGIHPDNTRHAAIAAYISSQIIY